MEGLVRRDETDQVEDVQNDIYTLKRREVKMRMALTTVISINLMLLSGFVTLFTLLYKE